MIGPLAPVVIEVREIDSTIYQCPIAWAWINNDGKMGFLFQGRYTAYVENINCRGIEGAGAHLQRICLEDMRNSWMVLIMPRIFNSEKFQMFWFPTWMTSTYFATKSISHRFITYVTMGRPKTFLAEASSLRWSSSISWKILGMFEFFRRLLKESWPRHF